MVPITIIGTRNIISKGSMTIHPGLVEIIVSPHVTLKDKGTKKGDEIIQAIRSTIHRNFENHLKMDSTKRSKEERDHNESL